MIAAKGLVSPSRNTQISQFDNISYVKLQGYAALRLSTRQPLPSPPYPLRSTPDCAGNLVERLWCRLKDWRRVATRYDKLAANFLSGALIAALIT